MVREISALELRKRFGEIMEEVRYRRQPYVVTRNGRPMIVLMDMEAYESMRDSRQDEAFVEEYSDERVTAFLREDTVDQVTRKRVRKSLAK